MFKKICVFYVDEVPVSRHIIKEIKHNEKGFYRAATSMEAFTRREVDVFAEHYMSKKPLHKRTRIYDYDDYVNSVFITDNVKNAPVFEHETIKDFYKAIGYDYKKKKYID